MERLMRRMKRWAMEERQAMLAMERRSNDRDMALL
jgi:hypothetical protein